MYIFLALLLYLHMQFYSNTKLENDRWTVETSFITRVNFYCKINFKELVDSNYYFSLLFFCVTIFYIRIDREMAGFFQGFRTFINCDGV